MTGIVININWAYFLGLIGTIVGIAYYANGRFTRLETNVEWLSESIRELAIKAENVSTKLFAANSPVSLTPAGYEYLERSGLKSYIDGRKDTLVRGLHPSALFDLYVAQDSAFRLLAQIPLDEAFARRLNKFAFDTGVSTNLLRRAAAIYLRDIVTCRH